MSIDKTVLEKVKAALLDGADETFDAADSAYECEKAQPDISIRQRINADRIYAVADNNSSIAADQNEDIIKLDGNADIIRAVAEALNGDTLEIKG